MFSKIIVHIFVHKLPTAFEIIFIHTFRVYLTGKINSFTVSMGSRLPLITVEKWGVGRSFSGKRKNVERERILRVEDLCLGRQK